MLPRINVEEARSFLKRKGIRLILLIILSSATLAVINYYSIKINSSVRAYIFGESLYSKGQKDASHYLVSYILFEEEENWHLFNKELNVPIGDSLARVGLLNDSSYTFVRAGFLQGRNHEEDVDNLIWLFKNFKGLSFMKEAIQIWKEGDRLVGQLSRLGSEVHRHIQNQTLDPADRESIIRNVNQLTIDLTIKEQAFSSVLGAISRKISGLLFLVNLSVILVIITSVVAYAYRDFRQLVSAQHELERINKNLQDFNIELDNFIYAASHDLKAPINNLQGLLTISKLQQTSEPEIIEKMGHSIASLKKTIGGLTEVMKSDKNPMDDIETVSFADVVQEVQLENQYQLEEANVQLKKDFQEPSVLYSKYSMRSIVQNLLSNAVKYRSTVRPCVVIIKSYQNSGSTMLEFSDNGIGMDLETNRTRLFKMFNRLHNHVEGTGVGLYMIKRIIEKQGGSIRVKSKPDEGTTFYIRLN
jgi:signal transduction histidine kinase